MMTISRRRLISALTLLPAARLLRAQQQASGQPPPPGENDNRFSTDVRVVNVFATVRDKKAQIVRNLTRDDFLLDEDGRPQNIKYFSQESNQPLTLGLLIDTSGSVRRVLPQERSASYKFLEQVLREDRDLGFVIHFDNEVELLQDLTPSRAKLERALDLLEISQGRQQPQQQGGGGYPGGGYPGGGGGGYPPPPRRRGMGGTKLYDAVFLGADEVMKKQKGRKALILMTDGVDSGSKETLGRAVEADLRADTIVYSILFSDSQGTMTPVMGRRRGMGYPGGGGPAYGQPDGKKVLQQISAETGGRFFQVSHTWPLDKVFQAIEEELRNQYSIGYTSDKPPDGGGLYRKIHLTTKQKNMEVQTRDGYYAT